SEFSALYISFENFLYAVGENGKCLAIEERDWQMSAFEIKRQWKKEIGEDQVMEERDFYDNGVDTVVRKHDSDS
ncbi:hypothetical protein Bpfe_019351, partial [Biomphalaria pfeifferi]